MVTPPTPNFSASALLTANDACVATSGSPAEIDTVGDCDELHGNDNHNKAKLSVDFKQSVNNLGWTTVPLY